MSKRVVRLVDGPNEGRGAIVEKEQQDMGEVADVPGPKRTRPTPKRFVHMNKKHDPKSPHEEEYTIVNLDRVDVVQVRWTGWGWKADLRLSGGGLLRVSGKAAQQLYDRLLDRSNAALEPYEDAEYFIPGYYRENG